MHSVEDYARQWIKHKREERQRYSFGWVMVVRSLIVMGQLALSQHRSSETQMQQNIGLSSIANMLLFLQIRSLTMSFICKSHYIDCLKKLVFTISLGNPVYIPTTHTKCEILPSHRYALCSFGISIKHEELDLLSL